MAFHRRTTLYHISPAARPDGEPDGRDEKEQIAEDGGERAGGMLPLLPVSNSI